MQHLPISVALKNADGLNAGISGLEYQWSFVSGPTTINVPSTWSTTSNITLNNLNAIGDYVFKLTVRKKMLQKKLIIVVMSSLLLLAQSIILISAVNIIQEMCLHYPDLMVQ